MLASTSLGSAKASRKQLNTEAVYEWSTSALRASIFTWTLAALMAFLASFRPPDAPVSSACE